MASQKKQITDALRELEGLYKSRANLDKKYAKEIEPLKQPVDEAQKLFEEARAPIAEKYAKQYQPVNDRIAALEQQVAAQMMSKFDDNGTPKLTKVESEKLIAEAAFSEQREVKPDVFIEAAKGKTGLWDCVNVLIGKAEKLLGKTELDKISVKQRKWRVSILSK